MSNLRIYIYAPKFATDSRGLISNMTIVSQNRYPKHPNKAVLVPN